MVVRAVAGEGAGRLEDLLRQVGAELHDQPELCYLLGLTIELIIGVAGLR